MNVMYSLCSQFLMRNHITFLFGVQENEYGGIGCSLVYCVQESVPVSGLKWATPLSGCRGVIT